MKNTFKKGLACLLCLISVLCLFTTNALADSVCSVSASSNSNCTVTVNLSGCSSSYSSYEVYRCKGNGDYVRVCTLNRSGSNMTWVDNNCNADCSYSYKVRACNTSSGSKSGYTGARTVTVRNQQQKPQACTGLSHRGSGNSCRLSWSGVKGASSYEVYCRKGRDGSWRKVATCQGGTTSCNIGDVKQGNTYYCYVRCYQVINGRRCYSDSSVRTCSW